MRSNLLKGVVLGAATSTLVLTAASALAGSGVGGVFNLGQTNPVNGTSTLSGTSAGAQLKVTNASTAGTGVGVYGQSKSTTGAAVQGVNTANGPALQASVTGNGVAPLKVNSTHVVSNLNADMVDGYHSSSFVKGGGALVSNHMTLAVGKTFQTILSLPGLGSLQVSCDNPGPETYFNIVDTSGHNFDQTWDIAGGGASTSVGGGFTTSATSTVRRDFVVLDDSSKANGPATVIHLWEFPAYPNSTHCFFQAMATVQG
jgi:hypothetical protein